MELLADLDRPGAWMLLVDGISQSHVDLDDPRHLDLEYMRGWVTWWTWPRRRRRRCGCCTWAPGALTLARYVAATRPGSRQLAVESDPEVARLVKERLPVGRPRTGAGRIGVRLGDARAVLERCRRLVRRGGRGRVRRRADARPPDLGGVHHRRRQGAGAVGDLRGQHRRRATAGARPRPGGRRARGVPARLRHGGGRGAAWPQVRQPGGRRRRARASSRRADRRIAADPFPARLLEGAELGRFTAGAAPIVDARAEPSPPMPPEVFA